MHILGMREHTYKNKLMNKLLQRNEKMKRRSKFITGKGSVFQMEIAFEEQRPSK